MINNPTIDGVSRELLACKCCDGGVATSQGGSEVHYYRCNNCEWRTHFYASWDKAAEEWNMRTPDICPTCDSRGAGCPDCKPEPEPITLREHCKQCAEMTKDWPESKRNCLGGAPAVERQELEYEVEK